MEKNRVKILPGASLNETRVAFCTVPHIGGIYSVYQKLRRSLTEKGFDVLGVQVGSELHRWEHRPDLSDDGIYCVDPNEKDLKKASYAFCKWVEKENIKIVLPMSSPAAMAAVPHLPSDVRVVTRCILTGSQSCRLVASNLDRVSRIVYTSPAQKIELTSRFKVPDGKFFHIPNCVDTRKFSPAKVRTSSSERLEIVYLGRLIQRQKNVFAIPTICRRLTAENIPYRLSVIGCGSDGDSLKEQLKPQIHRREVRFLGALPHDEVVPLLQRSHCLLLPSTEEGFPNTMIEAMACQVAPVVSCLRGITDWIIEDGRDGYLCDHQQPEQFVKAFRYLYEHPAILDDMSVMSRNVVTERFSLNRFSVLWEQLFNQVLEENPVKVLPRSWENFRPSPAFRKSKLGWMPSKWRNRIRVILSNAGIQVR